jgi:predicted O-methyltransferase YrrM
MLKNHLRAICHAIMPSSPREYYRHYQFVREARRFRREIEAIENIDNLLERVVGMGRLQSNQKAVEIGGLLQLLSAMHPQRLCEIGAYHGGTLALFARIAAPSAELMSVDVRYPWHLRRAYANLAGPHQHIKCLRGDSHSPETQCKIATWLGGKMLDFLFIDGDHSREGVALDYEMYGQFVRPGGIIAFHDIVPDYRTRFGVKTSHDVGQVPAFWSALRREHPQAIELVEDPAQDGYGIGVLRR